jgi:hypothetical protein
MPRRFLLFALIASWTVHASSPAQDAKVAPFDPPLPLVKTITFDSTSLDALTLTDPKAWRLASEPDGRKVLEQFQASKYEPKVRSPFNIALLPTPKLADLDLRLKVRSTCRDYPHRDVCLVFAHQGPSQFYYVHLGKAADAHAHSIFVVDDQPRLSIAEKRTDGTPWTDAWHDVRLVRRASDGLIQVYFDDLDTPIMTAHDTRFGAGRIGIGTFDDTARFDAIEVRGR